jgi:glyoxylase I family protein
MRAEPDHLDLVVSDLERSVRFYRELLGLDHRGEIVGERGERVVYVRRSDSDFAIGLRERDARTPHDRYAVGVHHVAFTVESREAVDERYEWLTANGVEIESEPREYDYRPGYYAVFFYDPDGIKLELLHVP